MAWKPSGPVAFSGFMENRAAFTSSSDSVAHSSDNSSSLGRDVVLSSSIYSLVNSLAVAFPKLTLTLVSLRRLPHPLALLPPSMEMRTSGLEAVEMPRVDPPLRKKLRSAAVNVEDGDALVMENVDDVRAEREGLF
ncbi:hypothetical protein Nepgr_011683 [Nepenthes gracilis]|uniref:Uncharacterized protein n=1 Tax=Nepenthes gracilis TaxID=150966 RepID=A0AAD3SFY0_NEPGR|nr:hypothetical protein Nepgr_011683 [Nepenthes gracilis]